MRIEWKLMAATLLVSAGAYAAGEVESKIAVADMERIMAAHPETREAEALLQKQAEEFDTEKDAMLAKFERLKKEFEEARNAADSKALSDEGRTRKREEAEDKLTTLRDYDSEVRQTALLRQKQLADRKRRMRDRIVGKIRDVVRAYAAEKKLVLVLDSGTVLDNAGAVLYNTDKIDITEDIVKLVSKETVSRDELEKTKEDAAGKAGRPGAAKAGAGAAAGAARPVAEAKQPPAQ
jgi:Skp family chaperone for outer membrane proteins